MDSLIIYIRAVFGRTSNRLAAIRNYHVLYGIVAVGFIAMFAVARC
jgi:hypothetical protein